MLAHKEINRLCRWQKELYKALDIQKREVVPVTLNEEMLGEIQGKTMPTVCVPLSTPPTRKNGIAMPPWMH